MGEMDLELASKQSGLHIASKHFSIPMHMFVAKQWRVSNVVMAYEYESPSWKSSF
jgi:hypothetical protein